MKEENINILKKSIRQRRAISSCLCENGSYNYSEEEKNKSKTSINSFHRKTTSSYFCGSYLSSNLEDELINNINVDKIYQEKNKKQEKEDNLDNFLNLSFHSYESEGNKKEEENKSDIKKNNKENEIKKNNNFVSFKNNLKNEKDKEERATKSYLLALGMTKNFNRKEQYIPTVSIIEEEKSDVIESKSEFSNKKKNIKNKNFFGNYSSIKENIFFLKKNDKIKLQNIFGKKKDLKEENKGDTNEQKEKNNNEKTGIKLSFALNEIIMKNNKREENKRKCLKKNKTLLLNSFLNSETNNKKGKYIEKINKKKEIKSTENNNGNDLIEKLRIRMEKKFLPQIKEKIRNSYFANFIKKRYNTENNNYNEKLSIKNKILQNREKSKNNQTLKEDIKIKFNNLADNINSNININKINNININKGNENNLNQINYKYKSNIPIITKIEYRPRPKIPHLRQKIFERKEINSVSSINRENTNKNNFSIIKNSAPNKKFISKYRNIPHKKTHSFNKDKIIKNKEIRKNCHSVKQLKSINETIGIIRIEKIKSKNNKKKLNDSNNSKNKHNNSSSFIKHINIISKSFREKEKNFKISIKKANSGTFRNDVSIKFIEEKSLNYPGNKISSINALKFYLKFEKKYSKIEVIKQIEKKYNSENNFFVIGCEKISIPKNNFQNNDIFIFKSLMKYYKKQNKFIKIYGDENESNVISVKNVNSNKFDIYQVNHKEKNELFNVVPIKELKFNFNAIFICKK